MASSPPATRWRARRWRTSAARGVTDAVADPDAVDAVFTGFDMSTKLKLMGVDVASFGDAFGNHPGAHLVSLLDTSAALYKKLVLSPDRKHLLGGMLVGDASSYGELLQLAQNRIVLPPEPESLILPAGKGERPAGMASPRCPTARRSVRATTSARGKSAAPSALRS